MRVVTLRVLKEYSEKFPNTKIPLLAWYKNVSLANWQNICDIGNDFNHVDYVGNNRYVFNIRGNTHRLIVIIIGNDISV